MTIRHWRPPLAAAVALALLAGCAGVSRREGADNVERLLQPRLTSAFAWRSDADGAAAIDARAAELLAAPLTPDSAFRVAQLRNPDIASRYAELGIAQADVVAASRIGNPGFSASALADGGPSKLTLGLSLPLTDLLLLPSRRRLAEGEYERAQMTIAAALMNLAADTADAWYAAAGADQVAAMRDAVAAAAAAAAELAARFHAAGNISALQLKLEQAAATQARIQATTARAEALRARLALNTRLGLGGAQATQWRFALPLAAPVAGEDAIDTLQSLAREQRLDLLAARREVDLLDRALTLARRWRLLGTVDVGAEREREPDGSRLSGPTLALALPLFDQGQAAIARAQARLEQGRAALARLELDIDNDVRAGVERVAAQREIAQAYRDALIPQREAVVAREGERYNYMLIGAFELLLARQQEFDAYQGYLEAVRDYWQARVALARAIGTRLPSDAQAPQPALDIGSVLEPAATPGHAGHGGRDAGGGHDGHRDDAGGAPAGDAGGHHDAMKHQAHDADHGSHDDHDATKREDHSAHERPQEKQS
jgi:outer membrane protein, heavy metal efflux system